VRLALRELHWLPIIYRIKFKMSLLMYLAHTHHCPSFVSRFQSPISRQRMCSSDGTDYDIPRTTTEFSEQAFCVSSVSHWSSILETIRAATDARDSSRRL